ncbi:hypothetical protein D3C73_1334430 [compost metagenome]
MMPSGKLHPGIAAGDLRYSLSARRFIRSQKIKAPAPLIPFLQQPQQQIISGHPFGDRFALSSGGQHNPDTVRYNQIRTADDVRKLLIGLAGQCYLRICCY